MDFARKKNVFHLNDIFLNFYMFIVYENEYILIGKLRQGFQWQFTQNVTECITEWKHKFYVLYTLVSICNPEEQEIFLPTARYTLIMYTM